MIINIYLTEQEKLKMETLSQKYKVSKSTVCDNVLYYLTKYLLHEEKQQLIEQLENENIYKDKNQRKTSIKPKGKILQFKIYKDVNKPYINAIKIYLHKDINKYLNEEHTKMFYEELNTKLQKTTEENWEYNKFIRNMARYANTRKN